MFLIFELICQFDVPGNYQTAEAKLKSWDDKIQKSIDERISTVHNEIKLAAIGRVDKLVAARKRDGQRCTLISTAIRFIQKLLAEGDPADMILLRPVIIERVNELLAHVEDDNVECEERGAGVDTQVEEKNISGTIAKCGFYCFENVLYIYRTKQIFRINFDDCF